jgi:hypothetical protein
VTVGGELLTVLRQTAPLTEGETVELTGVLLPLMTQSRESDILFVSEKSWLQTIPLTTNIRLQLKRSDFWTLNSEQPVVRSPALALTIMLYITMLLDLFGLVTLIGTLVLPHVKRCIKRSEPKAKNN